MTSRDDVTIVIPARNEAASLGDVIRVGSSSRRNGRDWPKKIFVVVSEEMLLSNKAEAVLHLPIMTSIAGVE